MSAFADYLCRQLARRLKKRRVVVFYDPRREFEGFIDELPVNANVHGLPIVEIDDSVKPHLARFAGSFFAVRGAVEPIVAADQPETLLIYVPGAARDAKGSVLMELEKAGTTYEPQLKKLARIVLRQFYTDGDIDQMLAADTLTYADVARLLAQVREGGAPSMLKAIFDITASEALITRWLADDGLDAMIIEKEATGELTRLIEARLGLALEPVVSLGQAREKALRFVLVNEFRTDLSCAPPAAIGMIPAARPRKPRSEHGRSLRRCAISIRSSM